MNRFSEVFNSLVTQSLNQVYEFILKYAPGIAFAFFIILLGWIAAVVIRKLTTKILRALGFDVLLNRAGFKRVLEKGGVDKNPSSIVGWGLYWMIFLNALIMAQDSVDLEVTSQFLQNVILYIPNIIVVIIILALALFISKFVAQFIDKTAHLANIPAHSFLGTLGRYAVLGAAVVAILEYVHVPPVIMSKFVVIIFAVVPVGFFLVFLIGGRDVITGILSGRFLAQELKKGDQIVCDSAAGRVETIGAIATRLKADNEEILIPNAELAKKIIRKK